MVRGELKGTQTAICRECGETFSSRFVLGRHYKEHPEHRLPLGRVSSKAQKGVEAMKGKAEEEGQKGKRKYVRASGGREHLIKFCPCCGTDIERLEQALNLLKGMR